MHVKQAANVLQLLEYFSQRRRPATLAEISDDLGWPRSSTFNIVGTVAEKGYLYEPRGRGAYYPTPRWLRMAQTVTEAEPLSPVIESAANRVAKDTGETTAVGAPAGPWVTYVHVSESTHPIRYFAAIGDRVPIQASSVGRALLAQYSAEERQTLYRKINFERFTVTAPASDEEVEAKLLEASGRGYHDSLEEYVPGLAGISVELPCLGRPLSMVVAGPVARIQANNSAIIRALGKAVEKIGQSQPDSVCPATQNYGGE